jgi:ABC-type sugar transport system ATPase subunit
MGAVQLTGVRKLFGQMEVIKGVDLTVADGELVVFVGPSGCGKSTLLRMIAGLEDVDYGDIRIAGADVTELAPARRGVAMVFQNYALYPHMTAYDNLAYGLRRAGMARADVDARVQEAAVLLQITELLPRRPKAMSGGQRQRVAIGRAIVRKPGVFLFDEPLSNLDAELRVEMRLELARLHRDIGATMIHVTHDQVEAMTLADRIVVMNAGRIEQIGTPAALYNDPDTIFVAGFLGAPKMNLLPVRVMRTEGAFAVVDVPALGLSGLPVPLRHPSALPATDAILGFRAEACSETGDFSMTLRAEVVENMGATRYLYTATTRGAAVVAEVPRRLDLRAGEDISLSLDASACLLFSPDGARL